VSALPDSRTVILGVAESDAHAVANHLIAAWLGQLGFTVVNLGTCTSLREFAAAVGEHPGTEAVLIGSLNGHARQDLRELPALRREGLLPCPVIVGGNIAINPEQRAAAELELLALGVDHVLSAPEELLPLLDCLRAAETSRV
jgi:methylaspartate mutase sigma subunit